MLTEFILYYILSMSQLFNKWLAISTYESPYHSIVYDKYIKISSSFYIDYPFSIYTKSTSLFLCLVISLNYFI